MCKILQRLLTINDEDSSHLTTDGSKNYVENLKQQQFEGSIFDLLSDANPELLFMLKQMLEFNPYFRPSARQLLKNKIFKSVRIETNEVQGTHSILISADKNTKMAVDYSKTNSHPGLEQAKFEKLKQLILLEALKFKNSKQL